MDLREREDLHSEISKAGGLVFFVPGIKGKRLRSCSVGCARSLLIEGNSRPHEAAWIPRWLILSRLSRCLYVGAFGDGQVVSLALNQGSTAREGGGRAWLCQLRFKNWTSHRTHGDATDGTGGAVRQRAWDRECLK